MEHLKNFNDYSINEDASATGGPAGSVSGSGVSSMPVSMDSNAQPSSLSGQTVDPAYTNNGGKVGGYISNPLNMGTGKKNVYQKTPSGIAKTKEHSSRPEGGQYRRAGVAKAALKNIQKNKDLFSKTQDYTAGEGEVKEPKVMNFNDFEKKANITKIKK